MNKGKFETVGCEDWVKEGVDEGVGAGEEARIGGGSVAMA